MVFGEQNIIDNGITMILILIPILIPAPILNTPNHVVSSPTFYHGFWGMFEIREMGLAIFIGKKCSSMFFVWGVYYTVFKPDRYKYLGTEYSNDLTVLTGIMVRTGVCLSQNRQSFQVSESF